jgi:predicted phage tail protein
MTTAVLREVRLYGVLGKRFGQVHRIAVASPAEAVRALSCTIDGFHEFLISQVSYGYKVIVGAVARSVDQLRDPVGTAEIIKVIPIIGGAKRAGIGQIILGAVIAAVSFVAGGYSYNPGVAFGISLMLGGVVQLLSPQRTIKEDQKSDAAKGYAFDGPINTSQQGLPVPLVIGRVITGSAVISAGLTTDDVLVPPTSLPANPPRPAEQPLYPVDGGG